MISYTVCSEKEREGIHMQNKKAQLDAPIVTFGLVLIGILIVAPVMIFLYDKMMTPFQEAIAPMSAEANKTLTAQKQTMENFWDFAILMAFAALVIFLLLSAFFIDVHPAFFVFYLIIGILTLMILPELQGVMDTLYSGEVLNSTMVTNHLNYSSYLASHLGILLLVVFVISAIIMYAKMRSSAGEML